MSTTKYKVSFDRIEAVEIEKETDKSVWLYGFRVGRGKGPLRRADKKTSWESYHDTWEDAHAFLMAKATARVGGARRSLELANSELGKVKGMKKPEGA